MPTRIRQFAVLVTALIAAMASIAPANVVADGGQSHRHQVQPSRAALPVMATHPQHGVARSMPQSVVAPAEAGSKAKDPIDLRLLVITATTNATETNYYATTAFLGQIGVPFDTLVATQTPLTSSMLWDGGVHGYYEGIILTTGDLLYDAGAGNWVSAFTGDEWTALWQYEALFGIRQVTAYTIPWSSYGFTSPPGAFVDTTYSPLTASLTVAGRAVYSYLNASNPVTFNNAWVYTATTDPSDATTTPLLKTSDGYAIASIHTFSDGRQNLAITADNNPYLLHSMLLSYGTINWVTKGLFLGQRHVQLDTTVDDLFIDDNLWDPVALSDLNDSYNYRLTGADITALLNWQKRLDPSSITKTIRVEWSFNGEGAVGDVYTPDTLTPAIQNNDKQFNFVNHTYSHINLDDPMLTADQYRNELELNQRVAKRLKLNNYWKDAFVQPDISGLNNQVFQQAAYSWGIRSMISDTSKSGWNNPTPNAGFWAPYAPILIIPRHPSNLFYNLTTPAEWVSEYNCYYGPLGGPVPGSGTCANGQWIYWNHDLSYAEILDAESNFMLSYLLKGDIDPLMFHEANLKAYDGVHSLYSDLMDTVLSKYTAVYKLPIVDDAQRFIGSDMTDRMGYDASGVTARLVPCQSITVTTVNAAVIPVTGVRAGGAETYGGQDISHLNLSAGQSVTIPTTVGC